MQYRRRLRSRIILSFLLFGIGLTGLFAGITLVMRELLEEELIVTTLRREVDNFVDFKRANPDPEALFKFSTRIEAEAFGRRGNSRGLEPTKVSWPSRSHQARGRSVGNASMASRRCRVA